MKTYLFHRMHNMQMMFYPVQYKDDDDAIKGAFDNPGTTMVTRADTGKIVWPVTEVTVHELLINMRDEVKKGL